MSPNESLICPACQNGKCSECTGNCDHECRLYYGVPLPPSASHSTITKEAEAQVELPGLSLEDEEVDSVDPCGCVRAHFKDPRREDVVILHLCESHTSGRRRA